MRKILSVFFIFAVLVSFSACSNNKNVLKENTNNISTEKSIEKKEIVMITDNNGRGDQSFIDGSYRGLNQAKEHFKDKINVRMHDTAVDGSNIGFIVDTLTKDENIDMIIGLGFSCSDYFYEAAEKNKNIKFVVIDYAFNHFSKNNNLVGVTFSQNEGSFIVGAIAALKTASNKVGFIGGMKSPLIEEFEAGYIAGVKYISPDINVLSEYCSNSLIGFSDPDKAREIADKQYKDGADIIYHAAGGSGLGLFEAAEKFKKMCIGVDIDQTIAAEENQKKYIITSMLKKTDVAIFNIIKEFVEGNFQEGNIHYGLKENGVDYAENEFNREQLKNIKPKIEEIKTQIIKGQIKVPAKLSDLK